MLYQRKTKTGFTLVELLIVVVVIGILSAIGISNLSKSKKAAYYNRALSEFRTMGTALAMYKLYNGDYPPDANRDIPPGIEQYINGPTEKKWPDAPWPNSVYDWDEFDNNGVQTYQVSIRFCPIGGSLADCKFPIEDWAQGFNVNSSVYYCIEGNCKPHPNQPDDYPGYCVNCGQEE